MIVGILALFATLFGGGSIDTYFLDDLDKGVKKYVTDKDRRKDLEKTFKDYEKSVKEYSKSNSKKIKELKKKNLDKSITAQWYKNFFDDNVEGHIEYQEEFIEQRLLIQQKITDGEWDQIIAMASKKQTKQDEKAEKKLEKHGKENIFKDVEVAIVKHVPDEDRKITLMNALTLYEDTYEDVAEAYNYLNANDSKVLVDRSVTRGELEVVGAALNKLREELYAGYIVFFVVLKQTATDEEYRSIVKAFNKTI